MKKTMMITMMALTLTMKQIVQLNVDVDAVAQQVAHLVVGSAHR